MKKKTTTTEASETPYTLNPETPAPADPETWGTYDLGCAGALVSVGFELVSLDKENPRKVRFVFRKKDGMDQTIEAYFSDRLELKARILYDNLRMLKNRIYST
jgi:hypothetical protein